MIRLNLNNNYFVQSLIFISTLILLSLLIIIFGRTQVVYAFTETEFRNQCTANYNAGGASGVYGSSQFEPSSVESDGTSNIVTYLTDYVCNPTSDTVTGNYGYFANDEVYYINGPAPVLVGTNVLSYPASMPSVTVGGTSYHKMTKIRLTVATDILSPGQVRITSKRVTLNGSSFTQSGWYMVKIWGYGEIYMDSGSSGTTNSAWTILHIYVDIAPPDVYGCMDPAATNYNPYATVDDGSCVYPVYGCMDPAATNYNPYATVDDGSCVYPVYGCMDPAATNYDPSATVDDGSCIYPTFWDYEPQRPTGPADGPYYPKPGNSINITSEVRNIGTGAGPGYEHSIGVWSDYNGYETLTSQNMAGISRGSSRSISGTYTVPSTARDGQQVCFWTENTPVSGQSTPSMTTTVWGPDTSPNPDLCYTIYNQRFDLSTPAIGGMPTSAYPGQTITGIVLTVGNDDPNLGSSYPYATRGIAPSVTITTSGNLALATPISTTLDLSANGIRQWVNQTVTIPAGAVLGQEYCLILNANKDTGYSDGTGLAGSVQGRACITINDGPYLKVYGNDVLTGGGFNLDNFCPNGMGNISTLMRNISGTYVGAMDQYAAFAKAAITSFGTAGTGGGNLAFANTPSLGNFGEMPCARNLFDTGGDGGSINDDLWNNAVTAEGNNLNSFVNDSTTPGQYKFTGDQSINTASTWITNSSHRLTILIDGNLIISKDIVSNPSFTVVNGNPVIPYLMFIVTGDIKIDGEGTGNNTVRRLDGIFISRNNIDTCYDGDPSTGLSSTICDNSLEINGAFIAQNVRFKRTNGGTNQDVTRCTYVPSDDGIPISASGNDLSCTAEIFRFSPEVYIANPILNYGTSNEFKIQQIRDLPPVY